MPAQHRQGDSVSIIGRLRPEALIRLDAASASLRAEHVPEIEANANRDPRLSVEITAAITVGEYQALARECIPMAHSAEELQRELRNDIALLARQKLLCEHVAGFGPELLQEIAQGFEFLIDRVNPWVGITRDEMWQHVGATSGQALAHASLRLDAEALMYAASKPVRPAAPRSNKARMDAYLEEVLQATGRKLNRTEIWSSWYKDASEFMRWQRDHPNTTQKARQRFDGVLREKPHLQK